MMLTGSLYIIFFVMVLTLTRAHKGPSFFDQVLAINVFGILIVLSLALVGFISKRPDFLDIALLYSLINFVGTVAVLKYFKYGSLSYPSKKDDNQDD
jgi:multicomponent Na+:H+ antiporter subunit F